MKDFIWNIKLAIRNLIYWWKIITTDQAGDQYFLYRLERHKLIQMRDYFNESDLVIVDYKHMVSRINLAISLLNIIMQEDKEYEQYMDNNFGNIDKKTDDTAYIPTHVNYSNISIYNPSTCFTNDFINERKKYKNLYVYLMDIRREKAIKLYYQLRLFYTEQWWD